MQQALESIKEAWDAAGGFSWELVGQAVSVILVAALTMYVAKHAKNFRGKLKDDE